MRDQNGCVRCGKPPRVSLTDGKGGGPGNLCLGCYNKHMAKLYGITIPDIIPERLSFKDNNKKTCEFEIDFMIFGTGKSLTATEIGEIKRKVDVWGNLEDDFSEMFDMLKTRIEKAMSVHYMQKDGTVRSDKLVGYIEFNHERNAHDIIIDGIPFTWEEIGKNISIHEGWKIKIEFGSNGVDFN
jgi:hypothetical protein